MSGHQTVDRDTAACRARFDNGLRWIVRHLEYLGPEDAFNPEHLKETAELAILYSCLSAWSLPDCQPELTAIEAFLRGILSGPQMSEWVRKLPTHYSPYAVAYLPLRAAGVRIPEFEDALRSLRRAGYPGTLESTPYRELELQHLTWKAGLTRRAPRCDSVYRRTTLARARNPIYLSVAEVYSITHTLFYLADVAGPADTMPLAERLKAAQIAESLTVHFIRKRDWDVGGELLINLIALDRANTPLFRTAMDTLLAAWPESGALPGPGIAAAADAGVKDIVRHCYHTTLVGLLLCGAWLRRHA